MRNSILPSLIAAVLEGGLQPGKETFAGSLCVKKGRWRWLLYGLSIAVLVTGFAVFNWLATARGVIPADSTPWMASGVIEARRVSVAGELGGRLTSVPVREGDTVGEGAVVAELDPTLLDGQIAVAEAGVEEAEAGLARALAGARPGEIAVAEAQLAQARVGYAAARQAVSDTQALLDNPQELNLEIAVTRGQLAAAEHQEAEAVAQKDAVEVAKHKLDQAWSQFDGGGWHRFLVKEGGIEDLIDELPPDLRDRLPLDPGESLPDTGAHRLEFDDYELHLDDGSYALYVWEDIHFGLDAVMLTNTWWKAWVGVNAATASTEGVQAKLNQLYAESNHPQTWIANAQEAESVEAQLETRVRMAEIQVEALRAGLSDEEIRIIRTQVEQARAGLEALRRQREMLTLTAPISGTVAELLMVPGEVAAQGATLMRIADLDRLTLTVYVPETRLGDLQIGQPVAIQVDSFPDQTFTGEIVTIADQAEFTPRNVSTQEERVNLVFAVKIAIDNPGHHLKPGMPADATFGGSTP